MMYVIAFVLLADAIGVHSLTESQRSGILAEHNKARRTQAVPVANNMLELQYDTILESVAQAYLESFGASCSSFSHNSQRTSQYLAKGGTHGTYVGENWYSGRLTAALDAPFGGAVGMWTNVGCFGYSGTKCTYSVCTESQNFYQSGTVGGTACKQTTGSYGHFTQVMWATTGYVGCGYTSGCGTLCNYAQGGNFNLPSAGSISPSSIWGVGGAAASNCPNSAPYNNSGLCSTTNSLASSPTTLPTVSPAAAPTVKPVASPTTAPTERPVASPTTAPTMRPVAVTTNAPTMTSVPTESPTLAVEPSANPTKAPKPSANPTKAPKPTLNPTKAPKPTLNPTKAPKPTASPTKAPKTTASPTKASKTTSAPTKKK